MPDLKVEAAKALPEEPAQIVTAPGGLAGEDFVYAAMAKGKDEPTRRSFLFVHKLAPAKGQENATAYKVPMPFRAFDPQYSPNGEWVSFKANDPLKGFGYYRLYLWNMKTKEVQSGPDASIAARDILWSPDSKAIAYMTGGDKYGNVYGNDVELQLCTYDIQAKKSYTIASKVLASNIVWTNKGTLLYANKPASDANGNSGNFPDIYEVPATGGEAKVLIRQGVMPSPSPNGEWIAFFGPVDPDRATSGRGLCLFRRSDSSRQSVRTAFAGPMFWSADSKKLIVAQVRPKDAGIAIRVDSLDLATMKTVALINKGMESPASAKPAIAAGAAASTSTSAPRTAQPTNSATRPEVRVVGLSPDDKSLIFETRAMQQLDKRGTVDMWTTLQAIDLNSSSITTIGKMHNVSGYDLSAKSAG